MVTRKGFTMSNVKQRIDALLGDRNIDPSEKIHVLRQLEADALSKERSATEGLTPVDGDDGEDLNAIENALMALGTTPSDRGAATL
jgi:hypothetical protein